jgi:hypothetical protein
LKIAIAILQVKEVYKLLKRVGFVWIISRSRHPKSNPEEQLEFKKNSKRKSEKSSQKG